jgi:hypothetical protein
LSNAPHITLCRNMMGSNPGQLPDPHWLSDSLTTRLDLIHVRLGLIYAGLDLIHNQLDLIHEQLDLIRDIVYCVITLHCWCFLFLFNTTQRAYIQSAMLCNFNMH